MYSNTLEISEKVLAIFNNGGTVSDIVAEFGCSKKTAKKILLSYGIDYTKVMAIREKEKLEQVIALYQEGKSQTYIEKTLSITRKTIRKLLKSKDLHYKSRSEQHQLRWGTEIDNNAFDELTEESLYWIGMLYADGHITRKRGYSIQLTLHTDDIGHLDKYRKFLKSNLPINKRKDEDAAGVIFGSQRIHSRLQELGFTSDKSDTAVPHDFLKQSRDFWRGVIDGDGCLWNCSGKRERIVLHLAGTYDTCYAFSNFIAENGIISRALPHRASGRILYQISYEADIAKEITTLLYKDSIIYLDRKYAKYLEFIS